MYDYGARSYMPDIGRWGVVDMLNAFTLDSYGYANNNPIFFNDPTGMIGEDPKKEARERTIEEVNLVHINKKKVADKTVDYSFNMPSNCLPCHVTEGLALNFSPRRTKLEINYNGHMSDGPIKMMSSDVFGFGDLFGMLLSKVETKNRNAMLGIGLLAIIATKGKAAPGVVETELAVEKAEVTTLYHYTNKAGYDAIMETGELIPSIGAKNARYGAGQYFTDIAPGEFTVGQTSRKLFGVPWNKTKLTHYIQIDVSGLNVTKNAPYNFLVSGTENLSIQSRIVSSGVSTFK